MPSKTQNSSLGEGVQHAIELMSGVPFCQLAEGTPLFGVQFEPGKFELKLCPECEILLDSLREMME